jgi:hypothetical protein
VSEDQPTSESTPDEDELPPLEVVVDILDEVLRLLEGVEDLIGEHRRAARDDHHQLARLQRITARISDGYLAVLAVRSSLRSHD